MERWKEKDFSEEEGHTVIEEGEEDVGEDHFNDALQGSYGLKPPFNVRAFKTTIVDAWKLKKPVEV